MAKIGVVFLDVGGTLGRVDAKLQLHPFATTKSLLLSLGGALGLRLGVISNVPLGMHGPELKILLDQAGMLSYFDERLVIASTDAGTRKPAPAIYQYAASLAGVAIDQCMYIGDENDQVNGAIAAGMTGVLNPVP